jgi:hypothetical protein
MVRTLISCINDEDSNSSSGKKRSRARLVRRLIWVEDLLGSNPNTPITLTDK